MQTKSKLNLNLDLVKKAREIAKVIAADTQEFIDKHSTTSIERTVCRLLGIDGTDEFGVPLPNIIVDHIIKTMFKPLGTSSISQKSLRFMEDNSIKNIADELDRKINLLLTSKI